MTADLTTTTDVDLLVPGSLEALHTDADELDARADALSEAAAEVGRHVVAGWIGDAADGWATRRAALKEGLAGVADVFRIGAAALRAHADVVAWARARAGAAVDLWANAPDASVFGGAHVRTTRAAVPGMLTVQQVFGTGFDPFGLRPLAAAILTDAQGEVRLSAQALAAVLDELSAGLPDGRWHPDEFVAGIGDWLLGVASLLPPALVTRLIVDYDGVAAESRANRDALLALLHRPGQAVPTLLDTQTLEDNPARWWGGTVPDAALTVAGAGMASRALQIARTPVPLRTFTATDPHVADIANWIERQRPGWIRGVNHQVTMLNGHTREMDLEVGTVLVQVKSGNARHLTRQLQETFATTGRMPIGYAPDIPFGAWRNALYSGLRIARTPEELMLMLREFQ